VTTLQTDAQLNRGELQLDDMLLLDLNRTAEKLQVSRWRVDDLIRRGKLASVRHAGRHMVAVEEIESYLAREGKGDSE